MSLIKNICLYSDVDSQSNFEVMGDWLLSPARKLFGGGNVVYLKNSNSSLRFVKPEKVLSVPKRSPIIELAIKISSIAGLILLPLGLLFKSIALASNAKTREIFLDWKKPYLSSSNLPHDKLISELYEECVRKGLTKELYFEIVSNPTNYLEFVSLFHSENVFSPLKFSECACSNTGEFNRLLNNRRNNIEDKIVKDMLKAKVAKKPLNLLSLGSGNLLQDWILIGKLIKSGVKEINYTLVEPNLDPKLLEEFIKFFKDLEDCNIKIENYKYLKEFQENQNPPIKQDAVLAIDFDELAENDNWAHVNQARSLLSDQGNLYLSFGGDDISINQQSNQDFYARKGPANLISSDFANFQAKDHVSIATSLNQMLSLNMNPPILMELVSRKVPNIEITIVGNPEQGSNLKINLESFSTIDSKISVQFIESSNLDSKKFDLILTGAFEKDQLPQKSCDLLKETGIAYLMQRNGLEKISQTGTRKMLYI